MKKSYNSTTKKTNNSIKKWTKNVDKHFSKEDIQMAKEYTQKMLNMICHPKKKKSIKTTMRYHFTTIRMAIIKDNNKC